MTDHHHHPYHGYYGDDLIREVAADLNRKLDAVMAKLVRMENSIMSTLDEDLAEVTAQGTRLDSVVTLVQTIEQQLADALSGATLPPAVQQKVDAVFEGLKANSAKIDTALNANVPAPIV